MTKKIVLTGGGTAGHVNPNLAILPYLKDADYAVSYIGSKDGIEKQIIANTDIPYYEISSGKLRRYFSFKNFTDPFRIARGYFQAKKHLKKLAPDILFSKGGFVTVPVVFAANKLHIPVVLHESDYTPGLANKLCIPKAQRICVSFEAAAKNIPEGKAVITGSPVRAELFQGTKTAGLSFLGFSGAKPVLLIMGGSLGAQAVNEAIDVILDELLHTFDIAHIRGNGKLNNSLSNKTGYQQLEYINEELADVFAATDYIISRAGANAIFEFLALQIPSLLIPLPLEASRGDQILNAQYFEKKGYATMLMQNDITPVVLQQKINELVEKSKDMKEAMANSPARDGAKNVATVIFVVDKEHGHV